MRPAIYAAAAAMLALSAVSSPATAPAPAAPAPANSTDVDAVATIRPMEVRIRRLHRVRPDLLHYPIAYETVC